MMKGKFANETGSFINVVIVIAVLVIAGVLSQGFFSTRLDLTDDKRFTLSRAAVKTLENLPDLVTIKAVISSDLPTQFVQIKTNVTDLLEEFKAKSGGKLELVYTDPGDDEEKKNQVKALGIQEVQLQEQTSKGLEIKKGFFGLAITYGDKKEVIPVLSNLATFEYDLIVKIKKLVGSVKKIAVIEGSEGNKYTFNVPNSPQPQVGFNANYPALKGELDKLYTLSNTDISTAEIPQDIDLLIVSSPKTLTEAEIYRIDQFLMRGKSILFMTPGIEVNLGYGINGTPTANGYENLLNHWGMGVKKNVMLEDRNFQLVPFGQSIFPTPYPYWIVVGGKNLNLENTITSKLGQISFPWMSSLNLDTSSNHGDIETVVLASSTKGSWEESGRFNLIPKDLKQYLPVDQKSQPLAAMKMGTFSSYYETRPIPAGVDTTGFKKRSLESGRVLVVGNALFATDFYVRLMRATSNIAFVLNAVDQLALDQDLITIRSRNISSRPIPEESKASKASYVISNMVIAPLILLAIGIAVGVRRKRRG